MVDSASTPHTDPSPQPPPAPSEVTPPAAGPDIDPGRDNAARLQSRSYESDFAALPRAELEGTSARPGPAGGGVDDVSLPLVTIAVGCVMLLLALFFSSFLLLGAGLLVFVVGLVWRGVSRRRRR